MVNNLSALWNMIYPGRGIIGGLSEDSDPYFAYFCGGRSEGSQARRLVLDEKTKVIRAEKITDDETLKRMFDIPRDDDGRLGKLRESIAGFFPALTEYPAMAIAEIAGRKKIVVSNGAQTKLMYSSSIWMPEALPSVIMDDSFKQPALDYDDKGKQWINLCSYETDPPNNTSRINGVLDRDWMALSIIKAEGSDKNPTPKYIPFDDYYFYGMAPATGRLLTTYEGGNKKPLLAFNGEPLEVRIEGTTAFDIGKSVYSAIRRPNPADGNKCYGAAVAVIKLKSNGEVDIARINYADIVMGRQPGFLLGE